MKEISIKEIEGIRIGQTEDEEAGTGLTVLISEAGVAAGLDIRGGGPASRESGLLDPLTAGRPINAVVLGGGSAFGLDAAGGVMQYLEEHGYGFDVGVTKVPLVCQADIFDLGVGSVFVRPDKKMGYEAARRALEEPNYQDGCFGAGCGATVGKYLGISYAMKSGVGSFAVQVGDLQIGAVVVVNAFGDIYDWKNGRKIAGVLSEDFRSLRLTDGNEYLNAQPRKRQYIENTTIGAVITNAKFSKSQLCKIAGMAHDGYARSIRPVHTNADGDSIFALSTGTIEADQDKIGALGAEIMSEAIIRAVKSAKAAFGFPAYGDIPGNR